MKTTPVKTVFAALVLTSATCGRHSTAGTDASEAKPPTMDAAAQPAEPRTVDDWLTRIQQTHDRIRSLEAGLTYERNQKAIGDRQSRFGKLIYVAGPPPKFAVHFDKLVANRHFRKLDHWYVFDGRFLVERLRDRGRKQFFKRELVPADKVRKQNPLAFGEGPFVIPLPLHKDTLLARFTAVVVPAAPGDPPQTVHLQLTPKPERKTEFTRVDLWHDRTTLLPLKARTIDKAKFESIVLLDKASVKLNRPVDEKLIDTSPPTEPGWQIEFTPFKPRDAHVPVKPK